MLLSLRCVSPFSMVSADFNQFIQHFSTKLSRVFVFCCHPESRDCYCKYEHYDRDAFRCCPIVFTYMLYPNGSTVGGTCVYLHVHNAWFSPEFPACSLWKYFEATTGYFTEYPFLWNKSRQWATGTTGLLPLFAASYKWIQWSLCQTARLPPLDYDYISWCLSLRVRSDNRSDGSCAGILGTVVVVGVWDGNWCLCRDPQKIYCLAQVTPSAVFEAAT